MTKGTHRIAVTTGDQVEVFSSDPTPVRLGGFKLNEQHPRTGVWAGGEGGVFQGPLGTLGKPRTQFMYAGGSFEVRKLVNEVDELAWSKLLPDKLGEMWVAVRDGTGTGTGTGGGAPVGPPAPEPAPKWAEDQVHELQTVLDSTKDKDTGPRPDKLVPWPRKDGKWFVNVWRKGDLRTSSSTRRRPAGR